LAERIQKQRVVDMRPVYMIAAGSEIRQGASDKDFRLMVKEALDFTHSATRGKLTTNDIDGSVITISPITSRFNSRPADGADYVGLCPKPHVRIEGGGATRRSCFQQAWESVASGRFEVAAAMGFDTMSHVEPRRAKRVHRAPLGQRILISPGWRLLQRLLRHDGRTATCTSSARPRNNSPASRLRTTTTLSQYHTPRTSRALTLDDVMRRSTSPGRFKRHDIS